MQLQENSLAKALKAATTKGNPQPLVCGHIEPADAEGIAVEPAERHSQEAAKLMQPGMKKRGRHPWIVRWDRALEV